MPLLKENFEYQKKFDLLREDSYAFCPELQKPNEPLDSFLQRIKDLESNQTPLFGGFGETFGFLAINEMFILETQHAGIPLNEVLEMLNPKNELSEVSSNMFFLSVTMGLMMVVASSSI